MKTFVSVRWVKILGMVALGGACVSAATPTEAFFFGVDANYSLGMEAEARVWTWDGKAEELFAGMAKRGAKSFRVRLWTGDDGQNGKHYATRVVKRALAAGMDPYLVLFLSADWADLMKQPAPDAWKDLSIPARAEAIRVYSREVVAHFRKEGLTSHLYEIGNEIDYGICGVYPGKSTKKTPEGLGRLHWPQAATLIKASQAGVLEIDPDAKFMLHIAHWWDVDFCLGFFRFMVGQGVRVDFMGLSYFPSSNIGGSLEMAQFGSVVSRLHADLARPVIVPETAYPATREFTGQFSRWKKETPGYPLTPDGQRRWLADFLGYCAVHPAIAGVYYWSPEWCGEGMWKAFAFFDVDGAARPAWSAIAAERRLPRESVFIEVDQGRAQVVPLEAARARAKAELVAMLRKFGRVNTDYIGAITAMDVRVEGYRLLLRASLSGNLDLMRSADDDGAETHGNAEAWKKTLERIDPARQRVVVWVRGDEPKAVAEVTAWAEQKGVEVLLHPITEEAPPKFGLGQEWQKAVATGVEADAPAEIE